MSEQLSTVLAHMNLPQPERIFGPDEGDSTEELADNTKRAGARGHGRKPSQGVMPDEWDKIKLDDEVPEAVRTGKMTHSRNASKV